MTHIDNYQLVKVALIADVPVTYHNADGVHPIERVGESALVKLPTGYTRLHSEPDHNDQVHSLPLSQVFVDGTCVSGVSVQW